MSSRGEALSPQNSGTGVKPTGIVGYVDSLLLASKADLWITLHISKSPITSTSVLFKHRLKIWKPYILETLMPQPQLILCCSQVEKCSDAACVLVGSLNGT